MSYPGTFNKIEAADSPSIDAFGRWRVSLPKLRLSALFDYDKRSLIWDEDTTAGGAGTHLPNERCIQMTVSANGDEIIRQTKEYFVYRAAQSQAAFITFVLAPLESNLVQEVGLNDASNGIFLQASGTAINVVLRTSTSGSPVDDSIAQSSWNIDPMDGTGPSGITVDWTKTQILVIDYQWLGVGRVRIGLDIDGMLFPVHDFLNANSKSTVYMSTPKLPVRYRLAATGAIAGATSMKQICSAVLREGDGDEPGIIRSVNSGTTSINVGTNWTTVVGIRLQATKNRGTLRVSGANLLNLDGSDSVQYSVIINPGGTGGATWANIPEGNTIAQFSRSTIAITVDGNGDPTSGVTLGLGDFVPSTQAGRGAVTSQDISETLPVAANIDGTVLDEAWLIARVVTGTAPVRGKLRFEEIR